LKDYQHPSRRKRRNGRLYLHFAAFQKLWNHIVGIRRRDKFFTRQTGNVRQKSGANIAEIAARN
jgi:hypothetical protein